MTRTKTLFNNLLMSKKGNREHKLHIFETVFLHTKWKDCISRKNLFTKNLTYPKIFYVYVIAAQNLSKFTSWKTQRKYVNQTNVIWIATKLTTQALNRRFPVYSFLNSQFAISKFALQSLKSLRPFRRSLMELC